jgi:hypothetical protein
MMTIAIVLSKVSRETVSFDWPSGYFTDLRLLNIYSVPDCFSTIVNEQGYIMVDFIRAFLFFCSYSIIHCNVLFIKVTFKGKG